MFVKKRTLWRGWKLENEKESYATNVVYFLFLTREKRINMILEQNVAKICIKPRIKWGRNVRSAQSTILNSYKLQNKLFAYYYLYLTPGNMSAQTYLVCGEPRVIAVWAKWHYQKIMRKALTRVSYILAWVICIYEKLLRIPLFFHISWLLSNLSP